MTNQELHLKVKSVAKTYLQIEADLVALLIEMDRRRAFRDLGYASLFQYCVLELKLSEAVTSAFITVSRKAAVVPDLMEALETQTLTVSKAAKISSALDIQHATESKEVIAFASQHSTAETEKWLREKRGIETLHTLKLDSATMEKLRKVRTLAKSALSLDEALNAALDEFICRHDPLAKAERCLNRKVKATAHSTDQARPSNVEKDGKPKGGNSRHMLRDPNNHIGYPVLRHKRRALPATTKHFVIQRDKNRCAHELPNGMPCKNSKFLEIHHVRPLSEGGLDTPENLKLLCSTHHQLIHRERSTPH